MSRDEMTRLIRDCLADPIMIQETMTIRDRPGLERYVRKKGYRLNRGEMADIWELAAKVLNGCNEPLDAARWRMRTVGCETLALAD